VLSLKLVDPAAQAIVSSFNLIPLKLVNTLAKPIISFQPYVLLHTKPVRVQKISISGRRKARETAHARSMAAWNNLSFAAKVEGPSLNISASAAKWFRTQFFLLRQAEQYSQRQTRGSLAWRRNRKDTWIFN
jgi:hypothetical protein